MEGCVKCFGVCDNCVPIKDNVKFLSLVLKTVNTLVKKKPIKKFV